MSAAVMELPVSTKRKPKPAPEPDPKPSPAVEPQPADAAASAEKKPQINVRFEDELQARVEFTAAGLGLDRTNLVRMIVAECLPHYEQRAQRAKNKVPPDFLTT